MRKRTLQRNRLEGCKRSQSLWEFSPKCASKACFAPTASGVRRKLPTRPPHLRATAPRTQDNKKTTPSESNPYGPPSALSKTP